MLVNNKTRAFVFELNRFLFASNIGTFVIQINSIEEFFVQIQVTTEMFDWSYVKMSPIRRCVVSCFCVRALTNIFVSPCLVSDH